MDGQSTVVDIVVEKGISLGGDNSNVRIVMSEDIGEMYTYWRNAQCSVLLIS